MSAPIPHAPQGSIPAIGIPDSQDIPRLVYCAPYFQQVPLAELIEPSVIEAVEAALPSLVPPYVDAAAQAAVQAQAVLLVGSTMTGPLFLSPLMPTQDSQAATKSYVDTMLSTAGIPEVPPVPTGQVWARETGQWVPITPQTGVFLPLSGGTMQGNIAMSGNTINGLASVPSLPNGAAPAQWVLNQIASVSLFQGQWDADTNVPDLTQLSVRVNGYTWIAITTSVSGVVIGQSIPGLQGTTIFNGDTIYYSTVDGEFFAIHAGGLTLPEADARYVQLTGSQMSGALLLNANASQPLQAVTLQQMEAFVPPGVVPEAPNDGQLYGRNGLTASWAPVLPLAGGILTGSLTLSGNAAAALNPVPLQQMTSSISAATAGLLPLSGGTMTGLMTLSGNATVSLNPVPLQQLNAMLASYATLTALASYAPLASPTFTGTVTIPAGASIAGYAPLSGATFTGPVTLPAGSSVAGYLPLSGGTLSGTLTAPGLNLSGTLQSTSGAGINTNLLNCTSLNCTGTVNVTGSGASGNVNVHGNGVAYEGYTANAIAVPWNGGGAFNFIVDNSNLGYVSFTTSDARLKSNISPATKDALAAILAIEHTSFERTLPHPDAKPQHFDIGYTAQQLEPIIPDAIIKGDNEDDALGLDLMPMVAHCTRAIQQLTARLEILEGKS